MAPGASVPGWSAGIAAIVRHRWARAAAALWIVATGAALLLARGYLPFDRPGFAALPYAAQMAAPTVGLIEIFALMAVALALTRHRAIPDIAARVPDRATARREVIGLLAYAMLAQAGGWLLGPALGFRPFSFHLAGTLFGCSTLASPNEAWLWAAYNFVAFAVVPLAWFGRRYTREQLNLRSTDVRGDVRLIAVIMVLETAWEFIGVNTAIFGLSPHVLARALPLTLLFYGIGTVLPTMVLIYAILLPRYLRLTRSTVATVLLGGVTYAAMHLVEGWSIFDSPRDGALSLIFVMLGYTGPGMIKSVLTLRTGNAWVHAIGYHLVAPHIVIDTPLIAKVFRIV